MSPRAHRPVSSTINAFMGLSLVAVPVLMICSAIDSDAREQVPRPSILERLDKLEKKFEKEEDQGKQQMPPDMMKRLEEIEKKLKEKDKQAPPQEKGASPEVLKRLEVLEKKTERENLWKELRFQLSGYVDVAYTHNFNNPSSGLNQLRIFDTDANSFTPHMAQILWERPAEASENLLDRAGFRARINYGLDSRVTRARTNYLGGTSNDEFDFQEVYAQYILPIGNGLDVKFGKINTLIGYEVINSYENPNFSRSFMFGLGQAFTTTGLRLAYQFSPWLLATAGVVNGWDNVSDNNRGKTVEWAIALTPSPRFSLSLYGSWGPEQANRNFGDTATAPPTGGFAGDPRANRLATGAIVTMKPTDQDTVIVEPYYANEANNPARAANPALRANARWNGVATYLIHDFTPHWSLRVRGEIFEDAGGFRTCSGTWNSAGGTNTCFGASSTTSATPVAQTLWEVTPTLQYRPVAPLIIRGEYRYDKSDHNVFMYGTRATNHQQTASFEVIYLF